MRPVRDATSGEPLAGDRTTDELYSLVLVGDRVVRLEVERGDGCGVAVTDAGEELGEVCL